MDRITSLHISLSQAGIEKIFVDNFVANFGDRPFGCRWFFDKVHDEDRDEGSTIAVEFLLKSILYRLPIVS